MSEEIDGFLTTSDVSAATKWSAFWISQKIKAGTFPPPDVKGGPGRAHRWRRSTIQRALDQIQAASQSIASSQ